jgi:hypothetical protein
VISEVCSYPSGVKIVVVRAAWRHIFEGLPNQNLAQS